MLSIIRWFPTTLLSSILILLIQQCLLSIQQVEALPPLFSNVFNGIFNPIIDVIARSTCSEIQSTAVNDDERLLDYINCDCSGSFTISKGIAIDMFCTLSEAVCLNPISQLFCGSTNIEANYRRKSQQLKTTACIELETGLPIELNGKQPQIPELCLSAQSTILSQSNLYNIQSCSIKIDSSKCQSCTICESGKDVKFNCENVNLNNVINDVVIPGPVVDTCIGIGFIFNNPLFNLIKTDSNNNNNNETIRI
jgi:hypothetical protein